MNNRMLQSLLVAALSVSAQLSADSNSTNKTFLMPRTQGVNLPMHATTFYNLVHHTTDKSNSSNFALTGFWQQSENGKEQGKYFLADRKSTIDVSPASAASPNNLPGSSIDLFMMLHNNAIVVDADANSALISLNPRQEVYGARVDWHQNLDCLFEGLFLNAWIPFVNVSNNPGLKVSSSLPDRRSADTIRSFFAGNDVSDAAGGNAQAPLQSGKINGRRSQSGFADIDLMLGYQFLRTDNYYASIGIAATIPTSDAATGEWLFEPMVGNGNHWGLGGDFTVGAHLWHDDSQSLNANLTMKYRYLFEHTENRVLGLNGSAQVSNSRLAPYQLLGKDSAARNIPLVPAANVLNMAVDVTPGSQLDADVSLCYHRGGLSIDLGYNFYAHEGETVTRKASLATGYGIANTAFDTRTPFAVATPANVDIGTADGELTNNNIDTNAASTSSQFTNAIYGGAGYVFKHWERPVMLGLGAKYEWAINNNALEQWGIWLKAGVGF